ncbi:LRR receptor-like serine/threonine-protein kinase GSO1 [Solanum tuberosum]|uniref:LRR receptor-like serine/threonine-protein kinase GSO1 n=1 Tax=Solanum tuberosum TaxID=4113 RepID=UPI00073A075B|nr:PREDICTED: LRR receptor-like serine/threonine-protein kinase GSO1 [Solanum tuberosum]
MAFSGTGLFPEAIPGIQKMACIATNTSTDQSALLAFKHGVTLNSLISQNWSSQVTVCDWIGVTCVPHHHRVTALNIQSSQGDFPKDIGNLQNLKELILFKNQLTGSIPFSIFNISSLENLDLTHNQLSGSLPVDICRRLQRIKSISIISNHLSGYIPSGLSNCTELFELSLSYNIFTGTIPPEILNLERLESLNLGGNNLQGTILAEIGTL